MFLLACLVKSDCGVDEFCADAPEYVRILTTEYHHEHEIARIKTKANIRGRECSFTPSAYMKKIDKERVVRLWNDSVEEIRSILDAAEITPDIPLVMDVQFYDITEPVLRTTG